MKLDAQREHKSSCVVILYIRYWTSYYIYVIERKLYLF